MYTIKQPSEIIFGRNSARYYKLPQNSLVITSKGARSRGWLEYISLENALLFDNIKPNPSMESVAKILNDFDSSEFSCVIGIGGGSSLDIAKYIAFKLKKKKILIPTTFGSGSEVTRISVLKVNGKKQSFHDDGLFADVSIIDSHFIENTPPEILKNSVVDACAQCTEGYDSKNGNVYTKFLCKKAFDYLECGILHNNYDKLVFGSLLGGLGFGNCSTTLGHALSYVYSNEGISHGHAFTFTTTITHKFNNSIFYERFFKIVKRLGFQKISLKCNLEDASALILTDRRHLDNNPKFVTKNDIISLLQKINSAKSIEEL